MICSNYFQNSSQEKWVPETLNLAEALPVPLSRHVAYSLVHECRKRQDLQFNRRVYSLIVNSKLDSLLPLANHVIRLFATCESLVEAHQAFTKVSQPDHYTWNVIIDAHVTVRKGKLALLLYDSMQHHSNSDKFLFLSILKACTILCTIGWGRFIHERIIGNNLQWDVVVASALIGMYFKCNSLEDARYVFDRISHPDLISWNAVITGYAQQQEGHSALQCFENMQREGIMPDQITFLSILKACHIIAVIEQGKRIHELIIERKFQAKIVLGNKLIDMYSKCASLEDAERVFDKLMDRDVVSWTVMISAYTQHEQAHLALECFKEMQQHGIRSDRSAFSSILKACGNLCAITNGRCIHEQVIGSGDQFGTVFWNALIDMYAKCGSLEEASRVFDKLPYQDVVSCNVMIAGYALHKGFLSLECFEIMKCKGIKPSKATFLSLLKACSNIGLICHVRCIHEQIIDTGLQTDIVVGSLLVDTYAKCGILEEAERTFKRLPKMNVVSWGSLIAAYVQYGDDLLALRTFEEMQHRDIKPDKVIILSVLKAYSSVGAIEQCRYVHERSIVDKLVFDILIVNTLIDAYGKCGSLEEACMVFDQLKNQDIVSWNAMISGYVQHGNGQMAIHCLEDMQYKGIKPDEVTYSTILKACGEQVSLGYGRLIHEQIIESGFLSDVVRNSLVNVYCKCGSLLEAQRVFCILPRRDVVSWTAMLSGYAQLGDTTLAVQCFEECRQSGVKIDDVVLINVLTAYSRGGLLDEGLWYFCYTRESNETIISMTVCLVDLLGRAGWLNEAEDLIESAVQQEICLWMALLGACKIHCNVELGSRCFNTITDIDPFCSKAYVLMSNIYGGVHSGSKNSESKY